MVDLVVVYSPVGGGHKAAALAVAEAARMRGLSVEVLNAFEHAPRWAGDAYLAAHLTGQNRAPELYGLLYENANRRDGVLEPLRIEIDNLIFGDLAARVRELDPRVVVATHHLPLVVLGRARRRGRLAAALVGVVTDYTAHACWAEDGVDLWTVPCSEARAELEAHVSSSSSTGASASTRRARAVSRARWTRAARTIETTGIPVRAAFERIAPLSTDDGPLRVLVTSGGFGASSMTRIVRSFAGVSHLELTVVCGASAELERRAARAAKEVGVLAHVIGFERDMPARMQEAHVVVGKAGGLTVTETMTSGRPMVIASAVPGNEKVNEEYVVRAGAGLAAAPDDVGAVVDELRAAKLLEPMGENARRLVPSGAADRVLDAALSLARPRHAAA